MSIRNPLSSDDSTPSVDDAILDAARSCILDFGLRRTTLAEVARRAGVSRPTVYRRWADTRAVVADLMTREIAALTPAFTLEQSVYDQLVEAVVDVSAAVRNHPLFVKILRSDQELFTTYVLERLGTSQKAIIDRVALAVVAGQRQNSVRTGDSRHIATMVLLIAQSAVQSAAMVAGELPGDALTVELRQAIGAYLAPQNHESAGGKR
ncbi:TetR/AcrR family transcriptional regulator [Rhodococcus tibetensis]|uniref:TetR/AcrR family transcriptional regulator n=1 Tax=Rhodococcus tibetensis TaxID=2965064 RepID=A0ABT1QAY6_9NOCA|nr:TetR/AcrR family transcriptional regulator [Rhodococcus sp. FXJ9.536]MCQ4119423.1 TetR/AcrR family transcriptional regulator [Rhodococcus sp. FXJ9.536]